MLIVYNNQEAFLTNEHNKKAFVELLIDGFTNSDLNFTVLQSANDADTLIVKTALDLAIESQPVTVVANDTDVLVLLVHHLRTNMANIFMLFETRQKSSSKGE